MSTDRTGRQSALSHFFGAATARNRSKAAAVTVSIPKETFAKLPLPAETFAKPHLPQGEGWGEGETPIGSMPLKPSFPGKSTFTQTSPKWEQQNVD